MFQIVLRFPREQIRRHVQARSRQRDLLAVVAVTLVVVLAGMTLAQSSTPTNIGTWKLNFAKSRALSADNGPASVSSTITNEAAGAGVRCTVAVVSAAEGTLSRFEFSGKYDGKDNGLALVPRDYQWPAVARLRQPADRRSTPA